MRRFLLAVGLLLLAVTVSPGRILDADVDARLQVARALWHDGALGVATPAPGLVPMPRGGLWTTYYGLGQSLVFIPFDWLGVKLGAVFAAPLRKYIEQLPVVFLYTPLLAVAWWLAATLLLTTWGWARREAELTALVFLATTTTLYYVTRVQQEEALLAVLLTLALVAVHRGRLVVAGLLAGAAVSVRLAAVLSLLPLAGLLWDRGLRARRVLLGFLPIVAAVLVVNHLRFGDFLSTGYDLLPVPQFRAPDGVVAWGVLLGLGKGMLVLSPPLLLALLVPREWVRANRGYTLGVMATFVSLAVLLACRAMDFEGGQCWGVRYLVHAGIFLLPLAAAAWRTAPRLAGGLLALGLVFQIASVSGVEDIEYRQTEIEGLTRHHLLLSPTEGQLGRRLANLVRGVAVPADGPYRKEMLHLTENYLPNLWGWSYGMRVPALAMPARLLWTLIAAAALLCLAIATPAMVKQRL